MSTNDADTAQPPLFARPTLRGDVGEGAVAVVVQEDALGETRAIDVHEAVVVHVGGGHTHPVRLDLDACLICDLSETQRSRTIGSDREVVAVQAILQRSLRWEPRILDRFSLAQHLALHQVQVEIAVVVVVEQPDTGRHDLRVVVLPGHPVEVDEIDPGRRRPLDEPVLVAWLLGCLRRRRGRSAARRQTEARRYGQNESRGHQRESVQEKGRALKTRARPEGCAG